MSRQEKEAPAKVGDFEEKVLRAVIGLGENAYGMTIRQAVEDATKEFTSIGAIYTTLERLERKGFVETEKGEATPERGGRAKRYFKVNGAGIDALRDKEQVRTALLAGMNLGLSPSTLKGGY